MLVPTCSTSFCTRSSASGLGLSASRLWPMPHSTLSLHRTIERFAHTEQSERDKRMHQRNNTHNHTHITQARKRSTQPTQESMKAYDRTPQRSARRLPAQPHPQPLTFAESVHQLRLSAQLSPMSSAAASARSPLSAASSLFGKRPPLTAAVMTAALRPLLLLLLL